MSRSARTLHLLFASPLVGEADARSAAGEGKAPQAPFFAGGTLSPTPYISPLL